MHSERRENILTHKFVKHYPANTMHDFTKRNEINITVDETRSRLIPQSLAIQALHRFVVTAPTVAQIEVGREARHMC